MTLATSGSKHHSLSCCGSNLPSFISSARGEIVMAAPVPRCDDSNAMTAIGFMPLPCSDTWNPPAGEVAGVRWSQKQCTKCARLPTPQQHVVCGFCYEFGRRLMDDWYQAIVTMSPLGQRSGAPMRMPGPGVSARSRMITPAWPAIPAAGANRFREFWTRLCVPCERLEQDNFERLISNHNANVATPLYAPPPDTLGMWDWPWNTCTCLKEFGWSDQIRQPPDTNDPPAVVRDPAQPAIRITSGPPVMGDEKEFLCIDHGHLQAKFGDRRAQRNLNDKWLRETSRSASGKLCIASARTKARRDRPASSSHRACRCGGDADTKPYDAEVLLCMACEGLWCLVRKGTPGSKYQNMQTRATRRNAPNPGVTSRSRNVGNMTLGRARENFTDE
ncbi:uncharacterized protein RCC_09589 [Ramularia collo-cygni]|uniref:Uncharacterized protein n=1 Tax=Ramularia collo-cygni TaxID=112498 RepID=A0A2D3VMB6_9PEZI|nr:uncharacterized protein RCC_09589 [Ramularia collo-cygni]CZT23874.1 uncharacterized protein RCC_09589 [Ramularia collo-cygni]